MRADSRLLLMGLVLCGAAGACFSDVDYLRAGRQSATSGGTTSGGGAGATEGGTVFESSGTGGVAGTFQTGGHSDGGKAGQSSGAGSGGKAGSAGGNGMAGTADSCGDPRIIEKFDFNDSVVVVDTSTGATKEHWVKGPYDSTDTSTGKADVTASPPANPKTLPTWRR